MMQWASRDLARPCARTLLGVVTFTNLMRIMTKKLFLLQDLRPSRAPAVRTSRETSSARLHLFFSVASPRSLSIPHCLKANAIKTTASDGVIGVWLGRVWLHLFHPR